MKVFLDTSSLFKLYHQEEGTAFLFSLFAQNQIERIYLAEITKIEFDSVVWKKYRKRELDEQKAAKVILAFEKDWPKYVFVGDDLELRLNAKHLVSKHGADGLRTLDSLQLASAIQVKLETDRYFTSDKLLASLFVKEQLPV